MLTSKKSEKFDLITQKINLWLILIFCKIILIANNVIRCIIVFKISYCGQYCYSLFIANVNFYCQIT